MISGIGKVVVPVDDQERAKEFWTQRMGFELRRDESYGDERWIEVSPPDGAPVLVLSPRPGGEPRREVPDELPHSPVFFDCADIEATHREPVEGFSAAHRDARAEHAVLCRPSVLQVPSNGSRRLSSGPAAAPRTPPASDRHAWRVVAIWMSP